MPSAANVLVVLGSMRGSSGNGAAVSAYVTGQFRKALANDSSAKNKVSFELIEPVSHFKLPWVQEALIPASSGMKYESAATQAWSDAVQAAAAVVFVTPVYNRGPPASLKLALDLLFPEWKDKNVAVISYAGGGNPKIQAYFDGVLEDAYKMRHIKPYVGIKLPGEYIRGTDRVPPEKAGEIFKEYDGEVQSLLASVIERAKSTL